MSDEQRDKYEKLRPPEPTPPDEICSCPDAPPVKLMIALGYNPIHCINCNLEVPPERLGLSEELAQEIAFWRSIHDAIDRLWLDSGAYEQWAEKQLSDISSPVNVRGREAQRELDAVRRCYYWYFQNESADDYEPITNCPSRGKPLAKYPGGIFRTIACEE